ncbi:MAG: hypothetical protein PUB21_11120 [Bacteroidales bacterium]|nr:hypothetical protein [Bacteroidales bacterium]
MAGVFVHTWVEVSATVNGMFTAAAGMACGQKTPMESPFFQTAVLPFVIAVFATGVACAITGAMVIWLSLTGRVPGSHGSSFVQLIVAAATNAKNNSFFIFFFN